MISDPSAELQQLETKTKRWRDRLSKLATISLYFIGGGTVLMFTGMGIDNMGASAIGMVLIQIGAVILAFSGGTLVLSALLGMFEIIISFFEKQFIQKHKTKKKKKH